MPSRSMWLGLLIVLSILYWRASPDLHLLGRVIPLGQNANVAEADAWRNGYLDLSVTTYDAASFRGRSYSVFPPLWTLVSALVLPFSPEGLPRWVYAGLVWLPVPFLTYALFWRVTRRLMPAVLLSTAFLLGTSYAPVVLIAIRVGWVWQTNHALSQIGLLIFLLDYLGERRIWLGAIGLLLAGWSRPLTGAYLIPLAWAAWRLPPAVRRLRIAAAFPVLFLMFALPMVLNALKFGNPLESGYLHIYAERSDVIAQRAQYGLFAIRFLGDNLEHLVLGFPQFQRAQGSVIVTHDPWGAGLWWTTPLLLYVIVDMRSWWRDPDRRMLMLAVALILTSHLFYHNTGYFQPGYNRFSLDYMVVVLTVVAPFAFSGVRGWISTGLVAWSVWYFHWIT